MKLFKFVGFPLFVFLISGWLASSLISPTLASEADDFTLCDDCTRKSFKKGCCVWLTKHSPAPLTLACALGDCACSIVAGVDISNYKVRWASAILSTATAFFRSGIPDTYISKAIYSIEKQESLPFAKEAKGSAVNIWSKAREKIQNLVEPSRTKMAMWGLASINVGFALVEAYNPNIASVVRGMEYASGAVSALMAIGSIIALDDFYYKSKLQTRLKNCLCCKCSGDHDPLPSPRGDASA